MGSQVQISRQDLQNCLVKITQPSHHWLFWFLLMAVSEDQSALEGNEATINHTHPIHTCLKLPRTVKKRSESENVHTNTQQLTDLNLHGSKVTLSR